MASARLKDQLACYHGIMGEEHRVSPLGNVTYSNIEEVPWFHFGMTRNTAEVLLLTNGVEGNFLMRPSESRINSYSVSVRSLDAVKHFPLSFDGKVYKFGIGEFKTLQELLDHFDNIPVIGGQSAGPPVMLRYPYLKDVAEPHFYTEIRCHALCGKNHPLKTVKNTDDDTLDVVNLPIASKEGFLTKQGALHKNWKRRWFVMFKYTLQYYNQRGDATPIRTLDLRLASEVDEDETCGKPNAFRLVFPNRTFYMFADSKKELEEWLGLIRWKLHFLKGKDRSKESTTFFCVPVYHYLYNVTTCCKGPIAKRGPSLNKQKLFD